MSGKRLKIVLTAILLIVAITLGLNTTAPVNAASDITVDLAAAKQTIKGFGGINHPAWIGDLTESQRTTAFGNAEGQIGMSVLRMFVDENSNNWSRELATAKRAIALGATVFASPWNPPSNMTEVVNGQKRLRYDQYAAYANHLNSFVNYMKQNGVDLYAISVQNEPDYAAEWTGWTPQEMLTFMKQNAGSIQTRVIAPESFQYRKVMSDPILNDPQALANLDILGAHLYGTQLRDYPYPLFKQKGQGKELWMTEVYTDSSNDADLWPMALDVAYNIHNSMVEAEFNAYVWWYIRRSYGMIKENGQVSKRGYCMAQYSKFIRPGYVRVDATKNPTTDVYVSAYKSAQNVVVVVVNRSTSAKNLSLSFNGATVQSLTKYTTSGSKNVRNDGTVNSSGGSFSLSFDAQSVTTFVGSLTGPTSVPPTGVPPTSVPPTSVPPTTGPGNIYQAESATLGGGVTIDSNNTGFFGTGFANFPGSGGFVEFRNVDGGTGGSRTLRLRNALASGSRTGQLTVNGASTTITFTATGSWTTWGIHEATVTLSAGMSNTIQLQSTGQDLANLDQMEVAGGGTVTTVPPTSVPPTSVPPTGVPPTGVPPTSIPPTSVPPTSNPNTPCSPVTSTISVPFTFDGAGTFCWQASNLGSYINSWNLARLTINGVDVTNRWTGSSSYPPAINGFWYVSYTGDFAWSHVEVR